MTAIEEFNQVKLDIAAVIEEIKQHFPKEGKEIQESIIFDEMELSVKYIGNNADILCKVLDKVAGRFLGSALKA